MQAEGGGEQHVYTLLMLGSQAWPEIVSKASLDNTCHSGYLRLTTDVLNDGRLIQTQARPRMLRCAALRATAPPGQAARNSGWAWEGLFEALPPAC